MIDNIWEGVASLKNLLDVWEKRKSEIGKEKRDAVACILKAAIQTRAYIADVRDGRSKPNRDKESELANLWYEAHRAIVPIDYELADSCLIKADCWSDPRLWKSHRYKNVPLDLHDIIDKCRCFQKPPSK